MKTTILYSEQYPLAISKNWKIIAWAMLNQDIFPVPLTKISVIPTRNTYNPAICMTISVAFGNDSTQSTCKEFACYQNGGFSQQCGRVRGGTVPSNVLAYV